jgi:hypothetical protein
MAKETDKYALKHSLTHALVARVIQNPDLLELSAKDIIEDCEEAKAVADLAPFLGNVSRFSNGCWGYLKNCHIPNKIGKMTSRAWAPPSPVPSSQGLAAMVPQNSHSHVSFSAPPTPIASASNNYRELTPGELLPGLFALLQTDAAAAGQRQTFAERGQEIAGAFLEREHSLAARRAALIENSVIPLVEQQLQMGLQPNNAMVQVPPTFNTPARHGSNAAGRFPATPLEDITSPPYHTPAAFGSPRGQSPGMLMAARHRQTHSATSVASANLFGSPAPTTGNPVGLRGNRGDTSGTLFGSPAPPTGNQFTFGNTMAPAAAPTAHAPTAGTPIGFGGNNNVAPPATRGGFFASTPTATATSGSQPFGAFGSSSNNNNAPTAGNPSAAAPATAFWGQQAPAQAFGASTAFGSRPFGGTAQPVGGASTAPPATAFGSQQAPAQASGATTAAPSFGSPAMVPPNQQAGDNMDMDTPPPASAGLPSNVFPLTPAARPMPSSDKAGILRNKENNNNK